jgi:hypothetical protein
MHLQLPLLLLLPPLLLLQVEGVWLQDLSAQLPGYAGVGPCLVLRGRQPACGLIPACYLTDNPHVAIPLRQMSKVGQRSQVAPLRAAHGLLLWRLSQGAILPVEVCSAAVLLLDRQAARMQPAHCSRCLAWVNTVLSVSPERAPCDVIDGSEQATCMQLACQQI